MTTREFLQHILLNGEMDDSVVIEVRVPEGCDRKYMQAEPIHVTHLGGEDGFDAETLIECKVTEDE